MSSSRPQLSSVDGKAFGIVFDSFDHLRDWDGPFDSLDEAEVMLARTPYPDSDSSRVHEWNRRQQRLARTMDHYGIHPESGKYDFDELMEALAGEREVPRFGAISADESCAIVRLAATAEEAASLLADAVNTGALDEPVGVVDLDTGQIARPNVSVQVTLSPFEG